MKFLVFRPFYKRVSKAYGLAELEMMPQIMLPNKNSSAVPCLDF